MARMGIWGSAKRGEGWQLSRESIVAWVVVFVGAIVCMAAIGRALESAGQAVAVATPAIMGIGLLAALVRMP